MEREGSLSTQLSKAVKAYQSGLSLKAAALAHNVPRGTLYRLLRFANMMRPVSDRLQSKEPDAPSEAEVWERAAAIRESWTPEERARRWVANHRNDPRLEKMYAALRRAYRPAEAA